MTVTNQNNTVVYTGNGSATEFDYTFTIPTADDLEVYLYVVATGLESLIDPGDYSVDGIGEDGGGTVTYPLVGSPIASTHKIIIKRIVDYTQEVDITASDGFYPDVIEAQLDLMVMMIQQISEAVDRAVKLSSGNDVDDLDTLTASILAVADIETEIGVVAGIAANITTVAGISGNVTTVAGISGDVTTVAGISGNVTTVAGIAANVTTVAGIDTDVSAVAAIDTDVTAVAAVDTEVAAVSAIAANVTTVAGISANVTTVAGISANVTTVAGISADVTAVAAVDTDVTAVAAIAANVTTVAGIAANVTSVAAIDTEVAALAALTTEIAALYAELGSISAKLNTDGSNVSNAATFLSNIGLSDLGCAGRLTLSTGTPVTSADVTGVGTVFFTPYKGNIVWLYTGSAWVPHILTELSLALSGLTASRPADIFLDYNDGSPQLVGTSWSSDTARATALTLQNGVLVQTGNTDWRYLGTIYVDAANQCSDSFAKRHVNNEYNSLFRPMRVLEATNTWNYTTATWRQANANTANQLDFVCKNAEEVVFADVRALITNTNVPVFVRVGIGLDSTSAPTSGCRLLPVETLVANRIVVPSATWRGFPGIGRHTLTWLEYSVATGTSTWYGDNGDASVIQTGIEGGIFA